MELLRGQTFYLFLKVSIHDAGSCEVSLVGKIVESSDFYHPVKHPGSHVPIDFVVVQESAWDLIIVDFFDNLTLI